MSGPATPREALILARQRIESGERQFICLALAPARHGTAAQLAARDEIERLLGKDEDDPHCTLEEWLWRVGVQLPGVFDSRRGAWMREYRLRWIDHLLETNPVFAEQGVVRVASRAQYIAAVRACASDKPLDNPFEIRIEGTAHVHKFPKGVTPARAEELAREARRMPASAFKP